MFLWDYETFEDIKKRIPYFVEEVDNEKRLHSALGYCIPNEYEELVAKNINNNLQTLLTSEVSTYGLTSIVIKNVHYV